MKRDDKRMRTEMESGFRNEGHERRKICDELVKLMKEINSVWLSGRCGFSCAACTGFGLGSGLRAASSFLVRIEQRHGYRGRSTSKDGSKIGRRRRR